jgi:hypothetical protein
VPSAYPLEDHPAIVVTRKETEMGEIIILRTNANINQLYLHVPVHSPAALP